MDLLRQLLSAGRPAQPFQPYQYPMTDRGVTLGDRIGQANPGLLGGLVDDRRGWKQFRSPMPTGGVRMQNGQNVLMDEEDAQAREIQGAVNYRYMPEIPIQGNITKPRYTPVRGKPGVRSMTAPAPQPFQGSSSKLLYDAMPHQIFKAKPPVGIKIQ